MRRIKQAEENINKLAQWFNKLCGLCDRLKASDETTKQTIETLQKQLEEHVKKIEADLGFYIDSVRYLSSVFTELKKENADIQKILREPNERTLNIIRSNERSWSASIKELDEKISATNVRIGRIENPPKFKEGNTVEEKSPDPYDLMGFVIVPCGTSTWISRSGTVVSWYYKQPGDVLATYKILAEDKKDVFELQENLLKLATTKEGETKKSKK